MSQAGQILIATGQKLGLVIPEQQHGPNKPTMKYGSLNIASFKYLAICPYLFGLSLFLSFLVTETLRAEGRYNYSVEITGIKTSAFESVKAAFEEASVLIASKAEGFSAVSNLRAKVKSDAELMRTALRSQGFYGGSVSSRISRSGNSFKVDISVLPGQRYSFGTIDYRYVGSRPENSVQADIEQATALERGKPAIAAYFLAAEARLANILPELGFPFAEPVKHDLVVDHESKHLNVLFLLNIDNPRKMGQVHYSGTNNINASYLDRLVDWEENDIYQKSRVEALRARLLQTSLFSSVDMAVSPAEDDYTDINVKLTETAHRTVGSTAGYSTAEGFGAEVFWEHRNMFSRGGVLRLTGRGAEIEQSLSGRLELPNFAQLDQTLSFESLLRRQNTDAFLSYEAELRGGLDRVLTDKFAVSAGAVLEFSDVTDAQGDRDFLLVSLPIGARWDSSDDLLNPSKGTRTSLVVTPATNLGTTGFSFLKSEFRSSVYFSLSSDRDFIMALRGRLGSIWGAKNATLPATQRFFAGGGGSIRGFSFQNVGPLDPTGDPLGGRSVVEIAGELRFKVSETIGLVPFIEGGNTYIDSVPGFSSFRWGTGLGARYHTSFGPIRFDVAVPIDRRPGESHVQLYISLGQAF